MAVIQVAGRLSLVTGAPLESEWQARQQNGDGGAKNLHSADPVRAGEIAGAEKIMHHAARAGAQRQKQGLMLERSDNRAPVR